MSRSYTLSSGHYASKWSVQADDDFFDRVEVNKLAIEYANQEDGPAKEALFLRLVGHFHGILIKHTNMVISGRMPNLRSRAGKDAAHLLKQFVPKGEKVDHCSLSAACRTLHLAFKQQTTDDIYDVMVMCFLRACTKYDPSYTEKVKQVCEVLSEKVFSRQFQAKTINKRLAFDASGHLRLLVRKKFLTAVYGPRKKVLGYQRGPEWPPPAAFFESGPVGFAYFASMWFKYYLAEYITSQMRQIETRTGVLQLGHTDRGSDVGAQESPNDRGGALPHSDGNYVGNDGTIWAADTTLMEADLDLSCMTYDWVNSTTDRLFSRMSRQDRWLLQMVYVEEMPWIRIAKALQCSVAAAQQQHNEILTYLRYRGLPPGSVIEQADEVCPESDGSSSPTEESLLQAA